ncbi:MAG TPA: hypothetical protein VGX49_07830 [Jatrophihabitans sp.]|jgi:hypothetical protein|nr:hypothetical protein [Jatrophihabitans sp.]
MALARSDLIAAWNCPVQSEKLTLAAGWLVEELAEAELLEAGLAAEPVAELVGLAGGVARLVEVHAAPASTVRPATSTDSRVVRRVGSTL